MFAYVQTTTLILAWCFVLSLAWSFWTFYLATRRVALQGVRPRFAGLTLPALVVAPVALVVCFRMFGVNLLFPVQFFAETFTIIVMSIVPALVLAVSSGLAGSLRRQIRAEYEHWSTKPFSIMARAVGHSPGATLRRLVLVKSLAFSWSQCLPWLFGELIIVETVFNAPGLGLDAWHAARIRDFGSLASTIAWLAVLYGACVLATAAVNRWIGRRLESYG